MLSQGKALFKLDIIAKDAAFASSIHSEQRGPLFVAESDGIYVVSWNKTSWKRTRAVATEQLVTIIALERNTDDLLTALYQDETTREMHELVEQKDGTWDTLLVYAPKKGGETMILDYIVHTQTNQRALCVISGDIDAWVQDSTMIMPHRRW